MLNIFEIFRNYKNKTYKVGEKEARPCLNCGKRHKHNNSFCSAKCCKSWRAKRKEAAK